MSLRATLNASSGPEVLLGTNADGTPILWMEKQWPFCSWAIFLFGAGNLFARRQKRDEHWYGWLVLVAYCLHQTEEHAYDLRGWRYSFVPSLNHGPISDMYQEACKEFNANADIAMGNGVVVSCPLDPKITLWVNTILIWIGFGGCMVVAEIWPKYYLLSGSLNWGTAVVNGIGGHILPAILTKSYNPGVVQSIFMVPLGIRRILASGRPGLCLVNGVISHLALVVGINIVFRFQTNETMTMSILMLIAALAVPLGISNVVSKRNKSESVNNNIKNQ